MLKLIQEEIEFLRHNYLILSNKELELVLNKKDYIIKYELVRINLKRPKGLAMNLALKGRKLSEQHRKNIGLVLIGNKRNKGKKRSEESKIKTSKKLKNHIVLEETRLKMRIKRLENPTRLIGENSPSWKGGISKEKDYPNTYTKNRRLNDKEFITKKRLRDSLYNALNRYTKIGKIQSSGKYGINYKEIIESLKPFPENLKEYHIDHIIPCSAFNLEDPEQVKICFSPDNLQWLPAKENRVKFNKIIF